MAVTVLVAQLFMNLLRELTALTLMVDFREQLKEKEWWDAGVVICLERGADLHMAQLMPLPLTCLLYTTVALLART